MSVDDPRLLERVREWRAALGPCGPIYTDPPWGDRLLKMFETNARKAGYPVPEQTTEARMLEALAVLVREAGAPGAAILYSEEGWERVAAALGRHAFDEWTPIRTTYGKWRKCMLILAGSLDNVDAHTKAMIEGLDRVRAVGGKALMDSRALWTLEPFAGTGRYSRALSASSGVDVLANEYDPRKAAKCRKALGVIP